LVVLAVILVALVEYLRAETQTVLVCALRAVAAVLVFTLLVLGLLASALTQKEWRTESRGLLAAAVLLASKELLPVLVFSVSAVSIQGMQQASVFVGAPPA
jgi:hypothetical protein